jgi:hypothetical protein
MWSLLNYHEASEKYWQRAGPFMELLTQVDLSPQQAADRDRLIELFHTKLTAEEFEQHLGLINRTYNEHTIKLTAEGRFALTRERSFLRLSETERFILKHANAFLMGGAVIIGLGALLETKKKSKPEAQTPPRQPWESAPSPSPTQSDRSAHEP